VSVEPAVLAERVAFAVEEVVRKQTEAGVDIVNAGGHNSSLLAAAVKAWADSDE
jgi:hypothetical protein